MANIADNYTITVLTFVAATMQTSRPGQIDGANANRQIDSGSAVTFDFVYSLGFPTATAFSVAWFLNFDRTQPLLPSPVSVFTPSELPSYNNDRDAFANAAVFRVGMCRVTAPIIPHTPARNSTLYYGRITIHQQSFNRNTGRITD